MMKEHPESAKSMDELYDEVGFEKPTEEEREKMRKEMEGATLIYHKELAKILRETKIDLIAQSRKG